MSEIFNNREIALGIWIVVFVGYVSYRPSLRKHIPALVKSVFAWKLSLLYLAILLYTSIVVYGLYRLNLWDITQLKNTTIWLLTVGLISLNDITDDKKTNYIRDTVVKIFTITTVLEFLIGFYTFSLAVELIVIPVVVLITLMVVVGKSDVNLKSAASFLNNLLALTGFVLIGYAIYKVTHEFSSFATKGTLSEFLISPVLTFLFLPFVYFLSLIVNMETVFSALKFKIKNKKLLRYAKRQALINFPFNKKNLLRWKHIVISSHIITRRDIRRTLTLLKQSKKAEQNPKKVPFELGWSPYMAKEFLSDKGLNTDYYRPLYQQEWQAASKTLNLDDTAFSSNLIYFVRGSQEIASKLLLKANVFFPDKAKKSHILFLEYAEVLFVAAFNEAMPKNIKDAILKGKNISIEIEKKTVSLAKDIWPSHKFHGYNLEFTIQTNRQ
ncbi:MAG: hypothetical protein JNK14_07620 [Chitinophagaceae bacterium]|nr:hypothetical protein [Chitinophagaceae bacterium]